MAQIYNSDLTKELLDGAKIQINRENIPNQLAEKVVPVMEVNPKAFRKINIIKTITGAGTVYTTPTDQDFFLCACDITCSNNVASKASSATLTITPKGDAAVVACAVQYHTTAILDTNNQQIFNNFNNTPILLERGSAITFASTENAVRRATIFGYLVYNTNA